MIWYSRRLEARKSTLENFQSELKETQQIPPKIVWNIWNYEMVPSEWIRRLQHDFRFQCRIFSISPLMEIKWSSKRLFEMKILGLILFPRLWCCFSGFWRGRWIRAFPVLQPICLVFSWRISLSQWSGRRGRVVSVSQGTPGRRFPSWCEELELTHFVEETIWQCGSVSRRNRLSPSPNWNDTCASSAVKADQLQIHPIRQCPLLNGEII